MTDYTAITEMPGSALTPEQWARVRHRYALARGYAKGQRALEVACGAGLGLPALAQVARALVGGDYMESGLLAAQAATVRAGVETGLARFDAHALPFVDGCFDLVLCFEAIYYFARPQQFLAEARRILAPGGMLLVGTDNPDWPTFMPGKLSVRYWHVAELHSLLADGGFREVQAFGAFPAATYSLRQQETARLRGLLLRYGLVPRSPVLRTLLQRVGYGKLIPLPSYLEGRDLHHAPVEVLDPTARNRTCKVIYLLGKVCA